MKKEDVSHMSTTISALVGKRDEEQTTPAASASAEEAEKNVKAIEGTLTDAELRELLRRRRMQGRGRPRTATDAAGNRTDGYSRTSLMVRDDLWAKIKEIAFRETLTMKEVTELALKTVVDRYEAKHGTVIPDPTKYEEKKDINKIF